SIDDFTEIHDPAEKITTSIIKSLDQGIPVLASFGFDTTFLDTNSGILSIDAFSNYSKDPKYRDLVKKLAAFGTEPGSHELLIVDYQRDETGKVIKYLAANSWGAEFGDKGFLHIYEDYFSTYIEGITVLTKALDSNP